MPQFSLLRVFSISLGLRWGTINGVKNLINQKSSTMWWKKTWRPFSLQKKQALLCWQLGIWRIERKKFFIDFYDLRFTVKVAEKQKNRLQKIISCDLIKIFVYRKNHKNIWKKDYVRRCWNFWICQILKKSVVANQLK